ncbi:hypothetical protein F25303_10319 [Fusarium sp. NRRL 25303]|nr:hypothetical protein F25303_10319 [Fusarium sp. NRRL 25303]
MKVSATLFLAAISAVSAADCPAPGQTNAAGDYSCNPAHDYPGQACALIDGCYFLRGLGLVTGTATKTTTEPTTKPTSSCPAPGQTNAAGDYSCNPAHEYPDQACALIDGCYFLRGLGLETGIPVPTPVIVNGAAQLSALGGSVLAGLIACFL